MLVFMVMISGLSPVGLQQSVYAEDKKEETKKEDDKIGEIGADNVYDVEDVTEEQKGQIDQAIKYSEDMQYLVTYTILTDGYATGKASSYGDLYNSGSVAKGWGENGLDKVIDTLKLGKGEVVGAGSSTAENDIDAKKKEEEEKKKRDKKMEAIRQDLIKRIVEDTLGTYTRMYAMSVNRNDNSYVGGNEESNILNTLNTYKQELSKRRGFISASYIAIKPFPSSIDKHNSGQFAQIQQNLKNAYSGKNNYTPLVTGAKKEADRLLKADKATLKAYYEQNVNEIGDTGRPIVQTYINNAQNLGGSNNQEGFQYRYKKESVLSDGGNVITVNIKPKSGKIQNVMGDYNTKADVQRMYPYKRYRYAEKGSKIYLNAQAYSKGRYDKLIKEKGKDLDAYYKYVKEQSQAGADNADKKKIKAVGWLPLMYKGDASLGEDKDYENAIEYFDNGVMEKDGKVTRTKDKVKLGTRYVTVQDLVAIKTKPSNNKGAEYSPYFSFNTEKNANNLATAYVGDSDKALSNKKLSTFSGLVGTTSKVSPMPKEQAITGTIPQAIHKLKASEPVEGFGMDGGTTVGIDNYGNIIDSEHLEVLIPYWQNNAKFSGLPNFFASPAFKALSAGNTNYLASKVRETPSEAKGIGKVSFLSKSEVNVSEMNKELKRTVKGSTGLSAYKEALGNADNTMLRQAIALSIVAQTKTIVAEHNKEFRKVAEETKELYLSNAKGEDGEDEDSQAKKDEIAIREFTEKDLLEKLRQIFEGAGLYELFRMFIATTVITFYTNTIFNFPLASVFYTSLITDSAMWSNIVKSLALLTVSLTMVYMSYMGLKLLRGSVTGKHVVKQFIAITLVIVLPIAIYAPLIHWTINKPAEYIVKDQLEQLSVLESYRSLEEKVRKESDAYKQFYGDAKEIRKSSEEYIVKIYTTTHREGYDIEGDVTGVEFNNKIATIDKLERGKWKENDLVAINVNVFDLFEWVNDDKSSSNLFTWLEEKKPKKYKKVSTYKEYSIDTSVKFGVDSLSVNVAGKRWTASELYKRIYQDIAKNQTQNVINGLYSITEVFRNRGENAENNKITTEQKENFVRDLSFTGESREIAFGKANLLSPSSMSLYAKYSKTTNIPSTDIFNLSGVVKDLVPYRDFQTTTLSTDVFEINKKILNDYIGNYSIVREVVGADNTNFARAEFRIITMNMWFAVNNRLDLNLFPTQIRPDEVSLDTYMRLGFIPMSSYANLEEKGLENVSKYIALRYHPFSVLVFLVALIALVVFGLTYVAVFYVLLMLVATIAFFWHYIIKNNYQNKSWLGTLMIIGSFALAKIGLVLIWKAMTYLMNYTFVVSGGETYPYLLLHSVIVITYIAVVFKFLFMKVLNAVFKDKENLGGEIFGNKIKDMVAKMKAIGRTPNPYARKNQAGKSVDDLLTREGDSRGLLKKEGALTASEIKQIENRNRGLMRNADGVSDIEEIIENGQPVSYGNLEPHLRSMAISEMSSEMAGQLGKDYDKIPKYDDGLKAINGDEYQEYADMGKVPVYGSDGASRRVRELEIDPEFGERYAEGLKAKGIDAYYDEKKERLIYDYTGYAMDEAGLKTVFGDTLDDIVSETNRIKEEMKIKTVVTNDLFTQETDKEMTLTVGKAGEAGIISKEVMGKYVDEIKEEAKNRGITVTPPITSNGEVLDGSLLLTNGTQEDRNHIKSMLKGYNFKEQQGLADKTYEAYEVQGTELLDKHLGTTATKNISRIKGEEGEKVRFLKGNKEHEENLGQYVEKNEERMGTKYNQYYDEAIGLTKFINSGGIEGKTEKAQYISKMTTAQKRNHPLASVRDRAMTVHGGSNGEKIGKLHKMLTQDKEVQKEVQTYADNRQNLYKKGEQIMQSNGQEQFLETIVETANKNGYAERDMRKVTNLYGDLKEQKRKGIITEREYDRDVEKLVAQSQISLRNEGKLGELYAEGLSSYMENPKGDKDLKEEARKGLNQYAESRKQMKERGIDVDYFDQKIADTDAYADMLTQMASIKEIQPKNDGILDIKPQNTDKTTSEMSKWERETQTLLNKLTRM